MSPKPCGARPIASSEPGRACDLSQDFCEIVNNVLDRSRLIRIISHTNEISKVSCLFDSLWGASRLVRIQLFFFTRTTRRPKEPFAV